MKFSLLATALAVAPAAADVYFKEQFNDEVRRGNKSLMCHGNEEFIVLVNCHGFHDATTCV